MNHRQKSDHHMLHEKLNIHSQVLMQENAYQRLVHNRYAASHDDFWV